MLLCTWLLCDCKWADRLKLLLHSEHLYGLSPVWTLMWVFSCPDTLNDLSHMWHLYGFSPLWILLCTTIYPDCVNRLLQTVHSNGFSLMWTLMWLFRLQDTLNALSHKWHLYGFSPLWILLCLTRFPARVNRLLQTLHSNGFSPEWLRLCSVNDWFVAKLFPHSLHLYLLLWTFTCFLKQSRVEKRFSHWVHEYNSPSLCSSLCVFKLSFLLNRLSHTVHKYSLGLSSCGCSVISLLSALVFTSTELSPVQYAHNKKLSYCRYSTHQFSLRFLVHETQWVTGK